MYNYTNLGKNMLNKLKNISNNRKAYAANSFINSGIRFYIAAILIKNLRNYFKPLP